jgi:hypothetical protein
MIEPRATGRKQTEETGRSDPKARRWAGASDGTAVRNQDPTKKYKLVYRGDEATLGDSLEEGWAFEVYREGGPHLGIGVTAKVGEPISYKGSLLMSIDKEKYKDIERYGSSVTGARGQAYYDEQQKRMIESDGADPLRGIGGRFMQIDQRDPNFQVSGEQPDYGI